MKKIIVILVVLVTLVSSSQAQNVRVQLNFPVGISIGAPGPRPYTGAVWIGPEWQWRGGNYVHVPGYWARPNRHSAVWISGHWKYSRRGYRWVSGHWR
ncbi:MAG TPA: hypothetical protein VGO58_11975 [Chitinophagaceae bacterium]|jgi:hypothetical protein|nr:hypothetical protein [Chitinophagaceae bacterium]